MENSGVSRLLRVVRECVPRRPEIRQGGREGTGAVFQAEEAAPRKLCSGNELGSWAGAGAPAGVRCERV